jgi:hypothetical protein
MAWSRVFRIGGVSGQWLREPRSPLRLALMSALGLPSNTPLRLHPVEVAPVVADHEVEAYVVNIYMRSSECVRVRRLASRFVADTQLDGGVVLPVIYRGGQRSARAWCFAWNDKGVLGAMRATGGFGPDSCVRRMEVV